jgi:hypothetical protein
MKADAAARREDIKAKIDKRADILAMAERNVERAIRSMLGDERWEAPEMPDVTPAEVPEDQAMPLMSIQRRQRSGNGVRFRETMTGSLRVNGVSRATRLRLHAHIWLATLHQRPQPPDIALRNHRHRGTCHRPRGYRHTRALSRSRRCRHAIPAADHTRQRRSSNTDRHQASAPESASALVRPHHLACGGGRHRRYPPAFHHWER